MPCTLSDGSTTASGSMPILQAGRVPVGRQSSRIRGRRHRRPLLGQHVFQYHMGRTASASIIRRAIHMPRTAVCRSISVESMLYQMLGAAFRSADFMHMTASFHMQQGHADGDTWFVVEGARLGQSHAGHWRFTSGAPARDGCAQRRSARSPWSARPCASASILRRSRVTLLSFRSG